MKKFSHGKDNRPSRVLVPRELRKPEGDALNGTALGPRQATSILFQHMLNGVFVILRPAFQRYRTWVVWRHDGSNKFPVGGECGRIFAEPRLGNALGHLHVILLLLTTDLGKGLSLPLPQFCHLKKCSTLILVLVRIQYRKYVTMHKSIKPHINLAIKIIPRNQTFHFHVSFKRNIRSLQTLWVFFFPTQQC